ncbi:ABC transporter permease [Mycoplasma miroungirhinis]|uniref:ABC transporter permease n=1 Tax=Mycoplasma miroungirhinis TaxID=754516 RepID=A0A6M4JDZ7_9MOLU|nr:ABC transporter permease [Mycoplasma miroungirhinis]QJR44306.1 ABC transporter permease [Mycoplasma miroungirhinis]
MFKKISHKLLINTTTFIISFIIIFFILNILMQSKINQNLHNYNYDKNIFLHFVNYIKNVFNGSFGIIYSQTIAKTQISIPSLVFSYFGLSFIFTFVSFLLSLLIGNILGIISAKYLNKVVDKLFSMIINIFTSIPLIILMIILLVFSSALGYPSQYIISSKYTVFSILVPIFICFIGTINFFFFKARKAYLDYLNSEHYIFAKSLGFKYKVIFWKFILKELIISQIKYLFPVYITLITISLVIERIFNIPGQSVLISFAYNNAEVDILMFFFTFSLLIMTLLQSVFDVLINLLNPQQTLQNTSFTFWFKGFKYAFK